MGEEILRKDAVDEYRQFLTKYVLPITGTSNNNLCDIADKKPGVTSESKGRNVRSDNINTIFSAFDRDVFYVKTSISQDNLGLAHNLIESFKSVSEFRFTTGTFRIQHQYASDRIRKHNYKYAIQKGICDWCTGGQNEQFYKLFEELEKWSVKTYEGKKVTFGFIFDPTAKPLFDHEDDRYFNWLDFIKDDYAATLTDCIHSVILLDKNCNFVSHLSITKDNIIPEYRLSHLLPYRFAHIIDTQVYGTRVGTFLLNNGDIILSKNRAIKLIKRNHRWLNFSYDTFSSKIKGKLKLFDIKDELLQQVYASTLDVSLAHTGGIIAVINNLSELTKADDKLPPILNPCDNLVDRPDEKTLRKNMQEAHKSETPIPEKEINKRLLKRKAILCLMNNDSFQEMDRKLRTELISMDGACIINPEGQFISIGAIIRNDSGSSGGGRSSAAKKLSQYGFSIKISTDGYIELFADYANIYSIK